MSKYGPKIYIFKKKKPKMLEWGVLNYLRGWLI